MKETEKPTVGIQQQVVDKFIKKLREDKVSSSIVARLEKVIESGSISDTTIKKALLPDESSI